MKNLIYSLIFLLACCSVRAQKIVYDLPSPVVKKIHEHLAQLPSSKNLAVLMESLPDGSYILSVIEKDLSGSEGSKLINEFLIDKTNRFVKVDDIFLPLITREDLTFTDFGKTKTSRGEGKKTVIMQNDSWSIKFDKSGRIL